jgi:hypothetical protein
MEDGPEVSDLEQSAVAHHSIKLASRQIRLKNSGVKPRLRRESGIAVMVTSWFNGYYRPISSESTNQLLSGTRNPYR